MSGGTQAQQDLKITLRKSLSGRLKGHQACARGLGLRRINQTVYVKNTPDNLGMVKKISYLLEVSLCS